METSLTARPPAAPFTFYIALKPGEHADFKVVAEAALAWHALVKEVLFLVDPTLEPEIELIRTAEGSHVFETLVRAGRKTYKKHPVLIGGIAGLAGAMASPFLLGPVEHVAEEHWTPWILEQLGHSDHAAADVQEAKAVATTASEKVAAGGAMKERKVLFKTLHREPAIAGVAFVLDPNSDPDLIPRSQFPAAAGESVVSDAPVEKRTAYKTMRVTLVSPVLVQADRMWRFQEASGDEFSAKMKDDAFLDALRSGRSSLALRFGIEMEIELQVREQKLDGIWTIKERNVVKVYSPEVLRAQHSLDFTNDGGD